jgi:hypothetical protein
MPALNETMFSPAASSIRLSTSCPGVVAIAQGDRVLARFHLSVEWNDPFLPKQRVRIDGDEFPGRAGDRSDRLLLNRD